jgi:hypothetical protein
MTYFLSFCAEKLLLAPHLTSTLRALSREWREQ